MTDEKKTYSTSLVTQGAHRFFTLSMHSNILARCSTVDTREANPVTGFQRTLDKRRAEAIAQYIDVEKGTIPSSIVLSAQPEAGLKYERSRRSITFNLNPRSFFILDGQHRVYGFSIAKTPLRVPVVIYNNLTRQQECRLFIDINTKQRPVPNALLLDIKRLADIESDTESFATNIFDRFDSDPSSPLAGLLSKSSQQPGRLTRVTFNAALKTISEILSPEPERAYAVLAPYLSVWVDHLAVKDQVVAITNPTVFRAIMLLFRDVAGKIDSRSAVDYSASRIASALSPLLEKKLSVQWRKPGSSHKELYEKLRRKMFEDLRIS